MFVVMARFHLREGHAEAFDALVVETVGDVARHEPGARVYVSHESDQPDERVFYEYFASQDAFNDHASSPHAARFQVERGQHLAGPPVVSRMTPTVGVVGGVLFERPAEAP